MMVTSIRSLIIALVMALVMGLHSPAFSQNRYWREIKGKPLLKFDWNCASPLAYPKTKLQNIIHTSVRRESIEMETEADRAFAFDLNGDHKPEYFIPLVCGATGNCTWGVFTQSPARFLGIVKGQYIYVHKGTGTWPTVITYDHLSASEGSLGTHRFSKGRYIWLGDSYPVGPEGRTLEIQNVHGRRLPKFLDGARAACKELGW